MPGTEQIIKGIRNPGQVREYVTPRLLARTTNATSRFWRADIPGQLESLDELRATDDYLLIVLDACRADFFEDVITNIATGEYQRLRTEGHNTFDYIRECWPDTYPETTYVSGAPPIDPDYEGSDDPDVEDLYRGAKPGETLGAIVPVFEEGWNEKYGTALPESVTQAAMDNLAEERLVAHYYQPHAPFVGTEQLLSTSDEHHDRDIWQSVSKGDVSIARLRECYRANLEYAIYNACRLIESAEHENIVITADHGEMLGEFRGNAFAHPRVDYPQIRRIPWFVVDELKPGWQEQLDVPDHVETTDSSTGSVASSKREQLEDLGYL